MDKLDKALKVIYDSQDIMGGKDEFWKAYRVIEKAIKALEIIKEKEVNIHIFRHCSDLATYNDMTEENQKLTQQEYDLLKEVLFND